jgi:hypothetical protein
MLKLESIVPIFFERVLLKRPAAVFLCVLAVMGFLVFQARKFRLDASAETLLLENDEALRYARQINARYGGSDFLVLTFTPKEDLLSQNVLRLLGELRDDLKRIDGVESALTILDVPLLESPPVPFKEMRSVSRTLESPDVNMMLAREELKKSPLYENLLVGADLKTTAFLITFPPDKEYDELLGRRNALREKKAAGMLTSAERAELKDVSRRFAEYRDKERQERHREIAAIRSVIDRHRRDGAMFLGGVSMIADDMISFIKSDLKIFGTVVFALLVVTTTVIFRRVYWVILLMLVCVVSVTCTIGFLGLFGWEVTVISSNFISLQLIITLAMTIHLMVRYREFAAEEPNASQHKLILATVHEMLRPCVYSGLTTMAGFASLIFCNIRPVISFGYIMVVGVGISIIVPFLLVPTLLVLLPREKPAQRGQLKWSPTAVLGRFTVAHGPLIVVVGVVLFIINVIGIRRLAVENCFINYFKSGTEIYQGMKTVDEQLGGTTPLDVVLDFGPPASANRSEDGTTSSQQETTETAGVSDEEFEQFEEFESAAEENKYKYWFTPEKINRIAAVHNYLDALPETGKVLSVVTLVKMIESANGGRQLDSVELALLFNNIPDQLRQMLVKPYVSVEHNEVRITVRIRDSDPTVRRNDLLKKIRRDLTDKFGFGAEQVHLAGTLVLYNNMLQSLYNSQVTTMGLATLSLFVTFLVLFRSLRVALIAIFPNVLAVGCVLGTMGWLNIPLDMMTITIAAIGVGLVDDDTIHYIHRFRHEIKTTGSSILAIERSHGSIGQAIYYTTVTLVIGFSILSLSNFIPTIYFGLFTVLAIIMALLASLTLLPELLVLFRPYRHGQKDNQKRSVNN